VLWLNIHPVDLVGLDPWAFSPEPAPGQSPGPCPGIRPGGTSFVGIHAASGTPLASFRGCPEHVRAWTND